MKQTIKIVEVKEPPQMKNPAIQQGIRDKFGAQVWGEKNGYTIVYFMPRRQRVYAEKLRARVDEQARRLERRSRELLEAAM